MYWGGWELARVVVVLEPKGSRPAQATYKDPVSKTKPQLKIQLRNSLSTQNSEAFYSLYPKITSGTRTLRASLQERNHGHLFSPNSCALWHVLHTTLNTGSEPTLTKTLVRGSNSSEMSADPEGNCAFRTLHLAWEPRAESSVCICHLVGRKAHMQWAAENKPPVSFCSLRPGKLPLISEGVPHS